MLTTGKVAEAFEIQRDRIGRASAADGTCSANHCCWRGGWCRRACR